MKHIQITKGDLLLKDKAELVYEKIITPFGNSAKIDAPLKYRGRRALVIILKD